VTRVRDQWVGADRGSYVLLLNAGVLGSVRADAVVHAADAVALGDSRKARRRRQALQQQ
jgi:hypothetical protein